MNGDESLIRNLSALYGQLLVVMGLAIPIAQVISEDIPRIFYNSFYLYLYFGSILFLIYTYVFILRYANNNFTGKLNSLKERLPRLNIHLPEAIRLSLHKRKGTRDRNDSEGTISVNASTSNSTNFTIIDPSNHGSMYLKMGAIIFGIGSMIYSGLKFGQYFELRKECANFLMAVAPISRMIFSFLQMYFIFFNSRVASSNRTTVARFGIMHLIGTNLCIWLNVLIQETQHDIERFKNNSTEFSVANSSIGHHSNSSASSQIIGSENAVTDVKHSIVRRSSAEEFSISSECHQYNFMSDVISEAAPFLFPCTIEYSLLCSGVLYLMWRNIRICQEANNVTEVDAYITRKSHHHYSVDCAHSSRGLFMGILVFSLTIISLIAFYVLINEDEFKYLAIFEFNTVEAVIYGITIIAVVTAMIKMRELEFIHEGSIELDNILLIIAQVGVCIYTTFTIIGAYFSMQESHIFSLFIALLTLFQTMLQTLFILDGSRRCCYTADQLNQKPGRELITFLLVCNLAMWAICTFETSRTDVHPVQLDFYGIWAWTTISHVSMPLAIFYRFHVTVCLGEIWKKSYKLKSEFIGC